MCVQLSLVTTRRQPCLIKVFIFILYKLFYTCGQLRGSFTMEVLEAAVQGGFMLRVINQIFGFTLWGAVLMLLIPDLWPLWSGGGSSMCVAPFQSWLWFSFYSHTTVHCSKNAITEIERKIILTHLKQLRFSSLFTVELIVKLPSQFSKLLFLFNHKPDIMIRINHTSPAIYVDSKVSLLSFTIPFLFSMQILQLYSHDKNQSMIYSLIKWLHSTSE